jgi:hypothetical protein
VIVYFDTSAFVLLLVIQTGTPLSRELWDAADEVVTSRPSRRRAGRPLRAARVRRRALRGRRSDRRSRPRGGERRQGILGARAELGLATALTGG